MILTFLNRLKFFLFLFGAFHAPQADDTPLKPKATNSIIPVTAQAKYFLTEIPPRLVWGHIFGDEAAIEASGHTNVTGVVFEILQPEEYQGKIYTLRHDQSWQPGKQPFAIGKLYEFRAGTSDIGRFSFAQSTTIPARELHKQESTTQLEAMSAPRRDDLMWLVGRWRCITREWLIQHEGPLGTACEDALDYFNVYAPYADERLKLELTDNPEDRPISAEFLARHIKSWDREPFEEELVPMSEPGPVRISKDQICVGYPFNTVSFRYYRKDGRHKSLLILESNCMRLECYKLQTPLGDIKKSFVHAPIMDFTPAQIADTKRRYEHLCSSVDKGANTQ